MPQHTFILNGEPVTVDVEDDVRLLWVLRDVLGVTGPKYGCGLGVCKACTSHINGKAFNPCSRPGRRHHARPTRSPPSRACPRPSARTCTPCRRPGWSTTSPSAATASPARSWPPSPRCEQARAEGHEIGDADLDEIRNICRCGTYHRIREAITAGAKNM